MKQRLDEQQRQLDRQEEEEQQRRQEQEQEQKEAEEAGIGEEEARALVELVSGLQEELRALKGDALPPHDAASASTVPDPELPPGDSIHGACLNAWVCDRG
eukprot:225986-Rhodomonas_salina.1